MASNCSQHFGDHEVKLLLVMAQILVVTLQLQLVGPKQFEDWNLGCYPKLQLVGPKQSGSTSIHHFHFHKAIRI